MASTDILIIAGEKSAEEHAMVLLPKLAQLLQGHQLSYWGVGGDEMREFGVDLRYHLKDFSSMGFSEVINKIPFYFKALNSLTNEAIERRTQFAILIDFQDFNLRLAQKLSLKGIKVLYYVAPQAWAWKPHRAKKLAKATHTLYCILPFEPEWFRQRGVAQAIGVAHPIVERYKKFLNLNAKKDQNFRERTPRLLLLPGSRKAEIEYMLPTFIETISQLSKKIEVRLVRSSHLSDELFIPYKNKIDFLYEAQDLPKALEWADLALATSGTVTLTTALFAVPTVVCYRSSYLNQFIFESFIDYKGPVSLCNIVHKKILFPEFLSEQMTAFNLAQAINHWLNFPLEYETIKNELLKTNALLSGEKDLAPCIANTILSFINGQGNS